MYSSFVFAIQDLARRRLGSLPSDTLHSLSANLEGESLLLRAVIQTNLSPLQLDQINLVISKIVEDLQHVFGKQWKVCSEMKQISDLPHLKPVEIEIFNYETKQGSV